VIAEDLVSSTAKPELKHAACVNGLSPYNGKRAAVLSSVVQSVGYSFAVVMTARVVIAFNVFRRIDGNVYGAAIVLPSVNLVAGYDGLAGGVANLLNDHMDIFAGGRVEIPVEMPLAQEPTTSLSAGDYEADA
jgi:hypothetical protein